jgi:predicted Zn-dependent protease
MRVKESSKSAGFIVRTLYHIFFCSHLLCCSCMLLSSRTVKGRSVLQGSLVDTISIARATTAKTMNQSSHRRPNPSFLSGGSSHNSNKFRGGRPPPGGGGLPLYVWATVGGTTALFGYCYFFFLDEVPLTKRKRWIATSPLWERQLGDQEYAQLLQTFRKDILPPNHRASVTVHRVGSRITQAAQDFSRDHHLNLAQAATTTAFKSQSQAPAQPQSQSPAQSQPQSQPQYTYTVVRSDTANAFVLPGNHIFVMTGLFRYVHDEDELAAVLGHEMAHNLARHAGEKISGSIVTNMLARLSLLLDPSGMLFTLMLPAASVFRELPNSRTQETEADQIGVHIAAHACYDPRAAKRVFANMKAADGSTKEGKGDGGGGAPEFLSTHPSHDTRISNFDTWLPDAMKEFESDAGVRCRHVRRDMALARQHAARSASFQQGGARKQPNSPF